MQSNRINVHTGEAPPLHGHIRFVCLSDTHDRTNLLQVPIGDVLLHSGDFSRMGEDNDIKRFNSFLAKLPHRHKVVIAGNHDLSFDLENIESLSRDFYTLNNQNPVVTKSYLKDCIYLEDSYCNVGGYKIYGSPWTPRFCDWGFNLDRGAPIASKWALIPKDTEILLTHGPPHRILDKCYDGFSAGCEDLLNVINEINPLVHVFGHIHEGYGYFDNGKTLFINASTCNLRYHPVNPPIVFDLPIKS